MLVYAEEVERSAADGKAATAIRLVERLRQARLAPFFPVQCLAELHHVLVRKRRMSPAQASSAIEVWRSFGEVIGTEEQVFATALELASDHQLQIYDAIIFGAAAHARCDLLLSEDMQDGFTWRGVAVANPFAATLEPRLARLLG